MATTMKTNLSGLARRLVLDGLLAEDAAVTATQESSAEKKSFVSHLVEKGLVKPSAIAAAAASEFGAPVVDLEALDLDQAPVKIVEEKLIRSHRVLPLFQRGKRLFLAVSDPTNMQALDEIKFQTGHAVEAIVVEEDKLGKAIETALAKFDTSMSDLGGGDDVDLDNLDISSGEEEEDEGVSRADVEDAPVVRFVNKMLLDAINQGASDLHFEPYEKAYRVRFRVDGMLKEVSSPPIALSGKIAARLKVMSRLDIAERRVPQDGRMKMKLSKTRAIDFRVNSCPTLFGEKIVMRILDPSSATLGIDMLGYDPDQKDLYMDALHQPYGMILVTGPTGSGKTVSLYTGLNILNTADRNISTAEDPAEINLYGINQVNVNPKVGLTFAAALKAFLRQDPDIIMVGEIRDLETAEIAIKAAQTGHMVLSTLHTNDAPKTLTRMVDMGVAPFAIASSVNLIIAQRLGRRLCSCKVEHELPKAQMITAGFTEEDLKDSFTIYKPGGCDKCGDSGYKGRVGIYQVMPISDAMGRIIMDGGNSMDIAKQSTAEGINDLQRSGVLKVKQGLMGVDELHRVISSH